MLLIRLPLKNMVIKEQGAFPCKDSDNGCHKRRAQGLDIKESEG